MSMRAVVGWVAGLVGLAALVRLLARRRTAAAVPSPEPAPTPAPSGSTDAEDPADELRRKLDERRDTDEPAAEPPIAEAPQSLDERRAEVHARAREAIDALRPDASE